MRTNVSRIPLYLAVRANSMLNVSNHEFSQQKHKNCIIIIANFGYIRTTSELDFETKAFYNLTIKAQDAGSPSLSSFTYFEVTIEDVNDCTPQFNQAEYGYSNLPEDTVTG